MSINSKNKNPILMSDSFTVTIDSFTKKDYSASTYIDKVSISTLPNDLTLYMLPKTEKIIVKSIDQNDYMLLIYNGSNYKDLISFSFLEKLYQKYCEKQFFLKRKFDRFASDQDNIPQSEKDKQQKEFFESFQKILVKKLESILTEEG